MIKLSSVKRIYKLNIPNIFTTPIKITSFRILSCHLRWIAMVVPGLGFLLKIAYSIESRSAVDVENWVIAQTEEILQNIDFDKINLASSVNKTIWTCWWQGEKNAPEIVELCIMRMRKMSGNAKVVVIDKDNYDKYIKLPDDIINLFNDKKMSMAHFSDILRTSILSDYGGLWIDSTIWVHNLIPREAFNNNLYSVRFPVSPIVKADWGYNDIIFFMCIMGGRNRYFYKIINSMLVQIWRKNRSVVNYLIFDKIIRVIYKNIPEYREIINREITCDINEAEIMNGEAKFNLKDIVSEEEFNDLIKQRKYTKLTYKFNYPKTVNGQQTLYGRILNS